MTLFEAEKIASKVKAAVVANKKPRGVLTRDAQAMDVLLAGARATTNIQESRSLLALASFLGAHEKLKAKYRAACADPALALKCSECGADQDCCASTCDECKDTEACGRCRACVVCNGDEPDGSSLWVRPAPDEVLSKCISKWERPKVEWKDATSYSRDGDRTPKAWSIKLGAFTLTVLCGHIHNPDRWVAHLSTLWDQRDLELPAPTPETNRAEAQAKALRMAAEVFERALDDARNAR